MGILRSPGPSKPTRRDDQITGAVTRLPGIAIQVWHVTKDPTTGAETAWTLETTVTSDATDGHVNDITVAGAAGEVYRLVMLDDGQKRAKSWDQLAE
jgi:hypothetical protein